MDPMIINNFIAEKLADELCSFLDPLCKPTPRPGMSGALGYETSAEAAAVGKTARALRDFSGPKAEAMVLEIEDIYLSVRTAMESHFEIEMDLVNCNYQVLTEGAENPLHSDSTKLDGSPWRDDGVEEELEFSALLYLSTYNEDFTGGTIEFPLQNTVVEPRKGQLVFFKGDVEHVHGVSLVTGGFRKNLVFFFARKGNISSNQYFTN